MAPHVASAHASRSIRSKMSFAPLRPSLGCRAFGHSSPEKFAQDWRESQNSGGGGALVSGYTDRVGVVRSRPVRLRAWFLCLGLAGCASDTPKEPPLPTAPVIAATVQRVFAEARLAGAPEVSVIRLSGRSEVGDWMVCLKGSSPDQPQIYAIFFQNGQYLSSRPAAVNDRCNMESFVAAPSPQPAAPPPDSAPRPPPKKRSGAS